MQLIEDHLNIAAPEGVAVWDFDPYDPKVLLEPSAFYRELRRIGPLVYFPKYAILACGSFHGVKEILNRHDCFLSGRGVGLLDFAEAASWRESNILVEADQPRHTRLRRVMSMVLSTKTIRANKKLFQACANDAVKGVLAKGRIDAVSDLAEVFPLHILTKFAGMKQVDPEILLEYGRLSFDALGPDNETRRLSFAASERILPWINTAFDRENFSGEGFAAALYNHAEVGDITKDDARLLIRTVFTAGIDTSVCNIGNLLYCLANNPRQYESLRRSPKLIKPAVEEVLRYLPSIHSFCRTAGRDTELLGVEIQEGTKILCVLGAANRDEAIWSDPDQFDITRQAQRHLGMGTGIHACIGQGMARAETTYLLEAFLEKVREVRLADTPKWHPGNSLRMLKSLPLEVSAV